MALTVYTSIDNAWREYVNPLRGVTLERIVQLIEQGERGAFADLQWFYQAMERSDAIIATVLMRRRAALLSCQWDVKPEENPKDAVLAGEQAAFLRERYDRVKNLREAVAFLSTASIRGYSPCVYIRHSLVLRTGAPVPVRLGGFLSQSENAACICYPFLIRLLPR